MTTSLPEWEDELTHDPDEEYRALLRALRRTRGFGLLFVQCNPAAGERIIQQVQHDLSQKQIAVLSFDDPIKDGNLFKRVQQFLSDKGQVDVLFIQGLEHSLIDYEDTKRQLGWTSKDTHAYSWKGVPPIMVNLNQQRENFRDSFNTCFVFLVPLFVIKYLIHRAPDFFDWRSGIFELPMDIDRLQQATRQVYVAERSKKGFQSLIPQERRDKILHIQSLLDEDNLIPEEKANLFFEQALLFRYGGELEAAIASYDRAIAIKLNYYDAWYNRANALSALGRKQEAIDSYDRAIAIKPDKDEAWYNRGNALSALGRKQEAIGSYDRAIALKPDNHDAWNNRGNVLDALGRKQEAIDSYDRAIAIQPDNHEAWNNRGIALSALGQKQEAIDSYDRAIAIKPDKDEAWYNKACCYALWGKVEEAIETLHQAIQLHPEDREMAKTDADFDSIRDDPRFQALINGESKDPQHLQDAGDLGEIC